MTSAAITIGPLLRDWRERRRLTQLALALEASVSQRHLSFIESGRSCPSRALVLRLADVLQLPLRERNALLLAAGHAPLYPERAFEAPALANVRAMIQRILDGHLPHPALAMDRHWNLLAANPAVFALLDGVASHLLAPPANLLRLGLHPQGLAPRIRNLATLRAHLLARLNHEIAVSADPQLAALRDECQDYPLPAHASGPAPVIAPDGIVIPLELEGPDGVLSFISTTTVFGTAVDVTLAEVTIEAFFPADDTTARHMASRCENLAGATAASLR